MKCPNGSFVPYDKAPGTQAQDCKACPEGKKRARINLKLLDEAEQSSMIFQ